MVTYIGDINDSVAWHFQSKVAIQIGDCTIRRTFFHDTGANDRLASHVGHDTFHRNLFLLLCGCMLRYVLGQHNIIAFHHIMDTCSFKSLIEYFGYRLIGSIYINYPLGIDTFFIVDKQIVGLRLNLGKQFAYFQSRTRNAYFSTLRVSILTISLECYEQKKE